MHELNKPHVFKGAFHLKRQPGRMLLHPLRMHYKKRYEGKYKYSQLLFTFDLALVALIVLLISTSVFLLTRKPSEFADNIIFEASSAPREIISGAPSTLLIEFTNNTAEELRNARLTLAFPAYFVLDEILYKDEPMEGKTALIGSIPAGATGHVKIRGTMFGDVGGKQIFKSVLEFEYGIEKTKQEKKLAIHEFSPARSALELELILPKTLVSYQHINGLIKYKNTGPIDFPSVSIKPLWPEGFTLTESDPRPVSDTWELRGLKAGEEGEIKFSGQIRTQKQSIVFEFNPSFIFGKDRFSQQTLTHEAPMLPPQITVNHGVNSASLAPGQDAEITISYKNSGVLTAYDIDVGIETSSPFFATKGMSDGVQYSNGFYFKRVADKLLPGESGEFTISIPVRASILQTETTVFENIKAVTQGSAKYTLKEGDEILNVAYSGEAVGTPITTIVIFDSFGRYYGAQGDQLGRGPLPPEVGSETKYWIFWNIRGTTNALENVEIHAEFGANVRCSGKQAPSIGSPAICENSEVVWRIDKLNPTFAPDAKIAAIAFEVVLLPSANQIGSAPVLVSAPRMSARDAFTGAPVGKTGAQITTSLPADPRAKGLDKVEPAVVW
ncbi:MAG: hypothetical protein ACD_76C00007G0007 [uncultured bacterium]|nr:MAG: hypothetical protein ACD_76C00007G0007 [uncultured bacterium]HBD05082.1 hypothetical protein [Candidatus Uhrbacteria bacterium]